MIAGGLMLGIGLSFWISGMVGLVDMNKRVKAELAEACAASSICIADKDTEATAVPTDTSVSSGGWIAVIVIGAIFLIGFVTAAAVVGSSPAYFEWSQALFLSLGLTAGFSMIVPGIFGLLRQDAWDATPEAKAKTKTRAVQVSAKKEFGADLGFPTF